MKHLKVALLGIVSMLLMAFVVFIPMNAKAAKVAKNESVTLQNQGKQFYRFTLADDALVQINWSRNAKKTAHIRIYTDVNKTGTVYGNDINTSSGKDQIALREGVYYVDMWDTYATPTTIIRFDWTFASEYDKGNYCKKKAATLKADTLVEVVQVDNYNYARFYKINLKKAQKITIMCPYSTADVPLVLTPEQGFYDEWDYAYYMSEYYYDFSSDGKSKTTKDVFDPGTYYIVIPRFYDIPFGAHVLFKWK
jgi:hypothetical protein